MKPHSKREIVIEYLLMIIGVIMVALAVNVYYEPSTLVTGGVSGLAIIIQYYSLEWINFEIPIWLTNIVLNIPLFFLGVKFYGKNFMFRTIFCTSLLTVALYYTKFIPPYSGDLILCSIYGGVISGVGLGLVFKCLATTGGTDLAASIAYRFMRHYTIAQILMFIDSVIILLGMFAFGVEKTMYAIIAVYLTSKVIDAVVQGFDFSKAAFIISEHTIEIAEAISTKIERGSTEIPGKGMYSKKTKNVLICVVSQKQIAAVKDIVKAIDSKAFVIVADVKEVLGEGFRSINTNSN